MIQEDKKSIYLIGSLANKKIPIIAENLRENGFDVFDEWWAPGPLADSYLRDYAKKRRLNYKQTLQTYAAVHIFEFDKFHLDRCDIVVLAMKAGKSGHMEFGYAIGKGKSGYILFDEEPEKIDIMYQFATGLCFSIDELVEKLKDGTK